MNIVSTLNENLLNQPFAQSRNEEESLNECQQIAYHYSKTENSVAVLSDLKSNKSYIYNGMVAQSLGIAERNTTMEINSIWEEEVFSKIHPDDLIQKHLLELQFFHLLKTLPIEKRSEYHITSKMRMSGKQGVYQPIHHRMFYVCSCPQGNLWLALCLYNYLYEKSEPEVYSGLIVNSATGLVVKLDKEKCKDILSAREKEVLLLIQKGETSKNIAGRLSISILTVSRHRQNILEKLRVKNSIEACRAAKLLGLL